MPSTEYRFTSRWRVEGTPEVVFDLLHNSVDYVRWWPSVWLRADVVEPGDSNGVGRVVRFVSRGKLPYKLRWTARTVEAERPSRIVIRAFGDFDGTGNWTMTTAGPRQVDIEYVWAIAANKPMLRYLSPVFRPMFEANHRWAMARGEESLRRELANRSPHQLSRQR
jgi:hypothetical protein